MFAVCVLFQNRYRDVFRALNKALLADVHLPFRYVCTAQVIVHSKVFTDNQLIVVDVKAECVLAEVNCFVQLLFLILLPL